MKKILKRSSVVFILLLAICSACMFTACSNVEGKYKLKGIIMGYELYEVGDTFASEKLTEDYITLEMRSGGVFTLKTIENGNEYTMEGTWSKKEENGSNKVLLNLGYEVRGVYCKDGEIVLYYNTYAVILEKA